jgi:hypothetical protein
MPQRLQLSRRAGYRKPAGAIVVSRPGRFGNPFTVEDFGSAEAAVEAFERHLRIRRELPTGRVDVVRYPSDDDIRRDLAGRDLLCWCPPERPCHADVLLELANQ